MLNVFKVKSPIKKICCTLVCLAIIVCLHFNGGACLYNRFLHVECPGCGLTAAYLSLFKLDLLGALEQNFMFWSVPVIYCYFWFDYRLTNNKVIDKIILAVVLYGFIVKWIITLL